MMPLGEAWTTLGEDPKEVVREIQSLSGHEARVEAAERALAVAERVGKSLLGAHHPDRNPGDPGAARRFRRVGEALESIRHHTAELRRRLASPPLDDGKVRIVLK